MSPPPPERVFAALHTPSAVRAWWGASRVVVLARPGGVWSAVWGDEDQPDYVTFARLRVFDPPQALVMADLLYFSRTGPLPFEFINPTTSFHVSPTPTGSRLFVCQDGIPNDRKADDFYAACHRGWLETLASIKRFLET
jgi:uncharacterized protein YndB with AHSA1/START domain